MALPQAAGTRAPPSLPSTVDIKIVPAATSGFSFFPPAPFAVVDGCFTAAPGTEFEIEATLSHHGFPQRDGADRVQIVCASIAGAEINEQLVLAGAKKARFTGWLEDSTGLKRLRFAFPQTGHSTTIQ